MLIDWFTVASQLLNFIILVVLLKYLLYDRIIRAMDEREEKVQSRLEDANKKKNEAEEEVRKYQDKNRELEKNRKEILAEAKNEAEDRKKALLQDIRTETENVRKKWIESVESEKEAFLKDLRQMTGRHVYAAVKKVLGDLTNEALEKQMVNAFVKQIRTVNDDRIKPFVDAVQESNRDLRVLSGFEMSSNYREKIKKTIHEKIGANINISYETDPDMGLDMELRTAGRRFSWGIKDYLDRLEQEAGQALEDESQRMRE